MKKTSSPKQTANIATKEIEAILTKYNMTFNLKMEFPQFNILPDELKLAILIIEKFNPTIGAMIVEKKEVKDD